MSGSCSIKIKNVWIADGSGAPLRKGEVLVGDGRILALEPGASGGAAAERILEFRGAVLAPGFIDAHGHSDLSLPAAPEAFSKVSQGVTCEIAGNCGLSAFPLTSRNREHLEELYANYSFPLTWDTLAGYRARVAECAPAMDMELLAGHNTLRAAAAGYEKETLSPGELREMLRLADETLEQGALGFSFGLLYVPGKFAPESEVTALMRVAAKRDKICTVHLRSEGDRLLESLEEMILCAREAGLKKLHVSHFKTAGAANFSKLDRAIEMIREARERGIRVTCDRYPYTRSMTQLSVILPGKWADLDDSAIGKRLQAPEARLRLAEEIRNGRSAGYWDTVTLVSTAAPAYQSQQGLPLSSCGPDPALAVTELLAADAAGTTAAFSGMSKENLKRILALPFTVAGSDGNALPADERFGRAHPRAFGTLPRFLKQLLESGVSPEEAVRRATGLTAEIFGLKERGLVRTGAMADLVIFDPDELEAPEDFRSPATPASGILCTLKAGRTVFSR